MATPPNVIYLNSHDTGRCIQPMGHPVTTPHLQALAERGVLFRDCHTAAPTCSPSRAALMTGEAPHCNGVIGLAHRGFGITRPEHFLPHTLAAAGYHCASWGMPDNHSGANKTATGSGYAEHLDGSPLEDAGDDSVLDFLARDHERPFFLSVSHTLTHRDRDQGFLTPPDREREDPRYTLPPVPFADTPEHRADWAHFATDVRELDRRYGKVLAALDAHGLRENTLVIATTDHGVPFPHHKCHLTSHGTGVFLIIAGPGFTGGAVRDQLVTQLDLFPTICAAAGIPEPDWLQGRALQPVAADPAASHHEVVFSEVTYHAAYEPMRMVRSKRYCYLRRFDDRDRPVLPNCDRSPCKTSRLEHGWRERPVSTEELYDAYWDPAEAANRIDDPALAAIADDLRARLDDWMQRTDDPLLAGPVPPRPGSKYNDVDGLDPSEEPLVAPI